MGGDEKIRMRNCRWGIKTRMKSLLRLLWGSMLTIFVQNQKIVIKGEQSLDLSVEFHKCDVLNAKYRYFPLVLVTQNTPRFQNVL